MLTVKQLLFSIWALLQLPNITSTVKSISHLSSQNRNTAFELIGLIIQAFCINPKQSLRLKNKIIC